MSSADNLCLGPSILGPSLCQFHLNPEISGPKCFVFLKDLNNFEKTREKEEDNRNRENFLSMYRGNHWLKINVLVQLTKSGPQIRVRS